MIESWVGAMSTLLPRAIRESGHRFTFVTRELHHYLRGAPPGGAHPLLTADNILTAETNDPEALVAHLARIHEALGFDGVLSSCDYYLDTVTRVAAELGLPGCPPAAMTAARRKDLTRARLAEAGVAGPGFATATTWDELSTAAHHLGYPLVCKPVDLCAGMYVRRVDDTAQLHETFRELAGFPVNARGQRRTATVLLEELLTGPEYSVETVTFQGETTVVGVTDKSVSGQPWFVETGHMFPAALDTATARAVSDLALAAVAALGLDNTVAHTEVKLTPAGPRLVEVNPRPAGNRITELVRRVTGIDLPLAHAQVALGQQPDLTPVETGVGSAAVAFLLPPEPGVIARVTGAETARSHPAVVECEVKDSGHNAGAATSNNHYLGHVMTIDPKPEEARPTAEELVAGLGVAYSGQTGR
ncbi:ATP-grasp domain-containing protein [Salinactinospora qingdaonensis]|uniref:ATP-grasp domain-containing protein n=2 Tax=Salinactinospora qingdaonensis TaxID=702744 RepID=A0ABP7GGB9_9ACTN